MKTVGRLGGILYHKDVPILRFKCNGCYPMYYELLSDNTAIYPVEFLNNDINDGIVEFFIDRCTPDTRQNINEVLKETPIQYYNVERILRYCHAQSIHDCYWIEQDDDVSCWKGSPLEGIGIAPNTDWNNIYTSKKFSEK